MSTPTGPFSHGFKTYRGSQPSTSACRLLIFASDRTSQAWSNLSSIERCNCGQWSSTVRERWPSSSLCAAGRPPKATTRAFAGPRRKNDSRFSLQISGPTSRSFSAPHPHFSKRWPYRPTLCCATCQHSYRASKQVCGCYKEVQDPLRLNRTTRNGSSLKSSPIKCRMMQARHV